MSHALDLEALRKRFAPAWKAYGETNVAVLYDSLRANETLPDQFIRFTVLPSGVDYTNLGTNVTRAETFGRVWMQIGIPKDTLVDRAWMLADKAAAIFRRWTTADGKLRCHGVGTDTTSTDTHFIVNVKVSYDGVHHT